MVSSLSKPSALPSLPKPLIENNQPSTEKRTKTEFSADMPTGRILLCVAHLQNKTCLLGAGENWNTSPITSPRTRSVERMRAFSHSTIPQRSHRLDKIFSMTFPWFSVTIFLPNFAEMLPNKSEKAHFQHRCLMLAKHI